MTHTPGQIAAGAGDTQAPAAGSHGLAKLALGALGIVFGDIATSPLYALQEAFGAHGVAATPANVLGVLSLTFWSLLLVVSIKYAGYILRADNRGEGGSMALLALARRASHDNVGLRWWVVTLGLVGVALFFGDSVITPAISVLSAVEGLGVATPTFKSIVVPLTLIILIGLFALQRFGSSRVGFLFGPVMALWLLAIAALGIPAIVRTPGVLAALSPQHAVAYLAHNGFAGFSSLGAVVLVLTGVEALYADMGHFGARPIRAAWFTITLPALLVSYFGQGALLLDNPATADMPFYRLVPNAWLYASVGLACVATIIASQAVISGAFSMVREAVQLGYLPRLEIRHTSADIRGQVYLPVVNGLLLVLVLAAVLGFRSSDNLAAAFGFAVSGTMLISTVLILVVARYVWRWTLGAVVAFAVIFGGIDLAFFGANAIKIHNGGWFPLVLGAVAFVLMTTWNGGRRLMLAQIRREGVMLDSFVESIEAHPPQRVPGLAIFLTANPDVVPQALLHNLKHNKILHDRNVILTTETLDRPTADPDDRIELQALRGGFYRLRLRFGFAEDSDIPLSLEGRACGELDFAPMTTTYFVSRDTVVPTDGSGMMPWREKLFSFLARNAQRANAYFAIPVNRLVEIGSRVEI